VANWLGLLLYPEDGGDMFLWNNKLFPNCMALQPRWLYTLVTFPSTGGWHMKKLLLCWATS
jgi:hypothetical protein